MDVRCRTPIVGFDQAEQRSALEADPMPKTPRAGFEIRLVAEVVDPGDRVE